MTRAIVLRLLTAALIGLLLYLATPHAQARGYHHSRSSAAAMVAQKAAEHGVPERIALAVMQAESGGRCNARNGRAWGAMQLMPGTARALGVRNRMNCSENIDGGIRMLASIGKRHGWSCGALGLYERGEGAVPRCTPYGRKILALAGRI